MKPKNRVNPRRRRRRTSMMRAAWAGLMLALMIAVGLSLGGRRPPALAGVNRDDAAGAAAAVHDRGTAHTPGRPVARAARPAGLAIGGPCGYTCELHGIHKIRHVVIIMQENRSFDSYFGTFPGADGIPMRHGVPTVCVPDPAAGACVRPYHDTSDVNVGGPHGQPASRADINHGLMNGFVGAAERGGVCAPNSPTCGNHCYSGEIGCTDVMGYHTAAEIPNYWEYAKRFVLQDHMFASVDSWSLPAHLYMVSAWSAFCATPQPFSCHNDAATSALPKDFGTLRLRRHDAKLPGPFYSWTDITWLMHRYGVSWRYYVMKGAEPDCVNAMAITCTEPRQSYTTPGIWNPLPHFTDVQQDGQLGNIRPLADFFSAARSGSLPSVTWIVPNDKVSEHPPSPITNGQTYVTGLINTIMRSPDWNSTAIFLSWDDWGGFYDGVLPPRVDQNGYGLRVPGLVISPYAKRGFVDHQILSHDAYLKFIEDDFMHSQRLNPRTDGRPDPRLDVRENEPLLGNLVRDFNFNQAPRPPLILPLHPPFH